VVAPNTRRQVLPPSIQMLQFLSIHPQTVFNDAMIFVPGRR
jgi:hypothetical protein